MSEIITAEGVPEVTIGTPSTISSVPATFSGKWEDMAKDMANIAKEQGITEEPVQPELSQPPQAIATPLVEPQPKVPGMPVVPEVPAILAKEVEVPDKFKGADGKLDQEKLLKSYIEAEKTLKRAQNAATQPQAPIVEPSQNVPPAANTGNLSPFEIQVAQDIFNGGGFTEQQAISMARVQVRLAEARHKSEVASTFGRVAQLEETLTVQQQRQELENLAKTNPEVFTPKGHAELIKIREENPWINSSPEPWKAAAVYLLGQRRMQGQAGTVNIPTPTGAQQTVSPLPVTPSLPVQSQVQLNTPRQIEEYVKTLNPEQEAKFWQLQGLKWDAPHKQFTGI